MRKLTTLTLAILLVCSLALTSFAAWHPSIDGACNHRIVEVKINGNALDMKNLPEGAIRIVNALEAKEENESLPEDTEADTMTKTGLTYGQNAALVEQYRKTMLLGSVPFYIESHKIQKDWGTEEPMLPIEIARQDLNMHRNTLYKYDFFHVYDMISDIDLLRKAAGLKDDEAIETIDLKFSCLHVKDDTVVAAEGDLFKGDSFIDIGIVSGRTAINVEDMFFVEGEATDGYYSIQLDMKDQDPTVLTPHTVFTTIAKQAPAEHLPTPAN